MNDKRHYIELSNYKVKWENGEKKYEIANEKSWIISYNKDKNRYMCEKKSSHEITEMKGVENFISIWNYDMYNAIRGTYDEIAKITIYMEGEYFSGYICSKDPQGISKISEDIILRYINLLKDIADEDDNLVIVNK